ncbi:MAG: CBS domain-containing protein [Actinomycetota bacterium]|nr:CBS domain-containing protein [Actinomycetota bacterium]
MEIIVTHLASDFDSFSGMVAAKKLYPEAEIIIPSSINQNVREFILLHEEKLPLMKEISDINLDKVTRIIVIDTRIAARLGPVQDIINKKNIEKISIDHHKKTKEDISFTKNYYCDVGSTTTIIVRKIIEKNLPVSQFEATLFALGIYEDTGNFTYLNTTYEDMDAVSFLLKQNANIYVISKFLNLPLNKKQHDLLEKLILNARTVKINEKEILISKSKSNTYIEGLSVLTRKLSMIEEKKIVFCWAKMKDKIYLVGRSDDADTDVSGILAVFKGGGHKLAASAVIKDIEFENIEKILIDTLRKKIKKPILAKNVMTYPVRVINENESISYSSDILKKYGHTGIPIVDNDGILTGIITRKDLDKAAKHGLSHAPVKGFRSGDVITAGPNTTIEAIQRLMIENGIGRIPIVSRKKIIGIVTRKDIIRFLNYNDKENKIIKNKYIEKSYDKFEGESNFFDINLMKRINILFSRDIVKLLLRISALAKEDKNKVFLVGGMVRDIILNKPNIDIDIVVERDGISFSNKLAQKLNAKIWTHKKFKTSVIVLDNKSHIDIATARIEYYEKPAALPDIEEGSIRQDLYRRDFTINSMAVSLNKENIGALIDYFGGLRDIKKKKIKVMHKLSFIEDPTRIFRAVRFEQRFGFKIDNQTEYLIKHAIENNIITRLTGVRIRDELIAIVEEKEPWKPLKRLFDYNALKKIKINTRIDLKFQKELKEIIGQYNIIKDFYEDDMKQWRIIFGFLMQDKNRSEVQSWCLEMKIKKKDAFLIMSLIEKQKDVIEKLKGKFLSNSEIYDILKSVPPELLAFAATFKGIVKKRIYKYISDLKDQKLSIDGNELIKMGCTPSRSVGLLLDDILKMKLDGKIKNREDEIKKAILMIKSLKQGQQLPKLQ